MPRRLLTSSWPAVLVTAVGIVVVLLHFGIAAPSIARYALYLAGVALPGVFVWRLLLQRLHTDETDRPGPTWFEDLSLGFILGFGLQLPFFLVGVALAAPLVILVPPVVVAVLSVATPFGRRAWSLPTGALDVRSAWALALVTLYGVYWLARYSFPLRPLFASGNRATSIDETFHQALVADISHRFPPQIPFVLDTRLDYHWFVHAQVGASNTIAGLGSVPTLRLLLPTLVLVMAVLGLGAVALRLTRRPVAAVLAPALLLGGAYHLLGPDYGTAAFLDPYISKRFQGSPSQIYGVMCSMPAVMLILEVLRPNRRADRLTWVALVLALLGLSGAKATFMPAFVCGAVAAWVVQLLLTRRVDRAATGVVALTILVAAFAQIVLFGGQGGAMDVAFWQTSTTALASEKLPDTVLNTTLMTLVMLTAWLLYGVGLVALRRKVLDPRAVWLIVSFAAGLTVPFVLYRTGLSQLWFSRSVAELVVLASVWGLSLVLPRPLTVRRALPLLGLAAVAGVAAYATSLYVDGLHAHDRATTNTMLLTVLVPPALVLGWLLVRLLARLVPAVPRPGLVVLLALLLGLTSQSMVSTAYDTLTGAKIAGQNRSESKGGPRMFAAGGVEAAEYIKEHSSVDDVVATNIHCAKPDARRCDNRNFWVAAYAERRVVLEGWGYTAALNKTYQEGMRNAFLPAPDQERLALNDAAFTDPSPETIRALVDTYGVDWLFVGKKYEADLEGLSEQTGLVERVFRNKNYVVYQVLD